MQTIKEQILDLLGRKMIVFYLSLAGLIFLTWGGKLSGDNFMLGLGWVVSAVIVGNIGEWKYKTGAIDTSVTNSSSQVPPGTKVGFTDKFKTMHD